MELGGIADILSSEDFALMKRAFEHFLSDPDYATSEETGLSFQGLEFGQALPLEINLRDWNTSLDGGREYRKGDCFRIYQLLYEEGALNKR